MLVPISSKNRSVALRCGTSGNCSQHQQPRLHSGQKQSPRTICLFTSLRQSVCLSVGDNLHHKSLQIRCRVRRKRRRLHALFINNAVNLRNALVTRGRLSLRTPDNTSCIIERIDQLSSIGHACFSSVKIDNKC